MSSNLVSELTNLVAKVKAMESGDEKAALLKALGLKGTTDKPLFSTHTAKGINKETGIPYAWPMLRVRGGGKDTSSLTLQKIFENAETLTEFFQFVYENREFFGLTFSEEMVSIIDLVTSGE